MGIWWMFCKIFFKCLLQCTWKMKLYYKRDHWFGNQFYLIFYWYSRQTQTTLKFWTYFLGSCSHLNNFKLITEPSRCDFQEESPLAWVSVNAAPWEEHDGSPAVELRTDRYFCLQNRHHLELLTIAFVLTQWNYCKTCYLGNFNRKNYSFKICIKFIMHYYKIISESPGEI